MQERVKVFTYISGTGSTVIQTGLEEHINQWLASVKGKLQFVSQSESEQPGAGPHVTVCVWYGQEGRRSVEIILAIYQSAAACAALPTRLERSPPGNQIRL